MLPKSSKERKQIPIYSGLLKYFPDACAAVAHVSFVGNEQHNPGESLHWAKEKSNDHVDCIGRHLTDHASGERFDPDGERILAKVAWRALAALQIEIEQESNQCLAGTSSVQSAGPFVSGAFTQLKMPMQTMSLVPNAGEPPIEFHPKPDSF